MKHNHLKRVYFAWIFEWLLDKILDILHEKDLKKYYMKEFEEKKNN